MAGNSRDSGRAVTARALSVLTAFDARHCRQTLTEISRRTGIPLATTHRLVGELERWGALQRDRSGHYAVGLRLWELGRLAPVHTDLRPIAAPIMREVHETTGEAVHLCVRDGFEAVWVERVCGPRATALADGRDHDPGDREPLHTTAAGLVLLAHAPASLVDRYPQWGARRGLADGAAPTADGAFTGGLHEVRERGFAHVVGDAIVGNHAVAVPVTDSGGTVVASLGLVAHAARLRDFAADGLGGTAGDPSSPAGALLSAARALGRAVTGAGWWPLGPPES